MVIRRQCAFRGSDGEPCRAAPLKDSQFCWVHSPEHAQEVQEARKLGGIRRKREVTLAGAYEFDGAEAGPQIVLIIDMAKAHALDAMGEEDAATQIVERYL